MRHHNMKNEMQGNYFVYWLVLSVLIAGTASIVIQQMKLLTFERITKLPTV